MDQEVDVTPIPIYPWRQAQIAKPKAGAGGQTSSKIAAGSKYLMGVMNTSASSNLNFVIQILKRLLKLIGKGRPSRNRAKGSNKS